MLHVADMKKAANDNDEFSFITLGAATLNVVRYLQGEKQQEDSERKAQQKSCDEADAEQQRKGIDQGLLYAGIKGRL